MIDINDRAKEILRMIADIEDPRARIRLLILHLEVVYSAGKVAALQEMKT
jgi:hypothetical protein